MDKSVIEETFSPFYPRLGIPNLRQVFPRYSQPLHRN